MHESFTTMHKLNLHQTLNLNMSLRPNLANGNYANYNANCYAKQPRSDNRTRCALQVLQAACDPLPHHGQLNLAHGTDRVLYMNITVMLWTIYLANKLNGDKPRTDGDVDAEAVTPTESSDRKQH